MNTFKHTGDFGDIIMALPTIKALFGGTLYVSPGQGTREAMTPAKMEQIRPLLMEQEYIMDVKWHKGEKINYDFSRFREFGYKPGMNLVECQRVEVVPMLNFEFQKTPWLKVKPEPHGRTVLSRTARYHNPEWDRIWPEVVARYPDALFVGTKEEHAAFEGLYGPVEYRQTADFLELARVIAGCRVFVGNQGGAASVAEGLKVPMIQEVSPKQPDAIFNRPNAHFVRQYKEWAALHPKPKLLLALQFHPGDMNEAMAFVKFMVSIERKFRSDCELALVARFDVPQGAIDAMGSVASERFNVRVIRSIETLKSTGWPNGCNDLWRSLMLQLAGLQGERVKTDCNAVLTFEPDCVPLRIDWIDALLKEWSAQTAEGKRCFGTVHDAKGTAGLHINGNAVFSSQFARECPEVQKECFGPWDCAFAKKIMPMGADSNLIVQEYQRRDLVSAEELGSIRKNGVAPAFIHGIKHPDRFLAARANLHL